MAYDWEKDFIVNRAGETLQTMAPVILSASRATDIPAFYPEWFINRLRAGYLLTYNPFNRKPVWISTRKTRVVVFWSKYPKPLLKYLDELDSMGTNYYFLFTLNDYDDEKLETNVPPLEKRIETFVELSRRLGKSRVIWRFDPLVLARGIDENRIIDKIRRVGDRIAIHTEKLVFSFCCIEQYRKVRLNMERAETGACEFDDDAKLRAAERIAGLCRDWGIRAASCAEPVELSQFGIERNKCIDDDLMRKAFPRDAELMKFLRYDDGLFGERPVDLLRDKGQRKHCRCVVSKDVGAYDTCPFLCKYCYADTSEASVMANFKRHDPDGESLLNRVENLQDG